MQKKSIKYVLPLLVLSGFFYSSCGQKKAEYKFDSPPGYNLNKPAKWKMTEDLLEISGIAFRQGNADTVYAEQDEDGKLYYFHPGDEQLKHTKFAKQGDYEDVAIMDKQVIMLKSNGTLYSFPLDSIGHKKLENVNEIKDVLPAGEYEGLFADSVSGRLVALCKDCSTEKVSKSNSAYLLQPEGSTFKIAGSAELDVKQIAKMAGDKKIKFKPSAIARDPLSKQWFILSSYNSLLVVASAQWQVKSVYHLDPAIFLQPEGMAFDKAGNLYISNEGDEISAGNILMFTLNKN